MLTTRSTQYGSLVPVESLAAMAVAPCSVTRSWRLHCGARAATLLRRLS